jgi:LPXTG-site transpeptidase (sortase) family protein
LNAQDAGTKTVTNGIVPDSDPINFNTAGTFFWQAVYSGDANNNTSKSACTSEALIVSSAAKNSPTIATTLSSSSITVGPGSPVHDHSTLTLAGVTPNAGGTATYSVFTDSACSLFVQDAGTKTVTNGVVPDSNSLIFNTTGTYYWHVIYSGDALNNGAISSCTSEVLIVNKASPTIATTLSSTSIAVGGTVHDSATLTGATSNAIGNVTYSVYSDSLCTLSPQAAGIKTVANGVVPDSDPITFPTAGTYYWQAVYTGGPNNNGATSACTSEALTVTAAPTPTNTPRPIPTNTPRPTPTNTPRPVPTNTPHSPILPGTGFSPQRFTVLSAQPAEKAYADLGDLWLEIPRLGVQMPIVGVPQQADGEWDVSWLGNAAGWLNGTAFPTWSGNSVLTGHVYDADGNPGPFVHINGLWWGDQVIVHAWGAQYVYEVRSVSQVTPGEVSSVITHKDLPWVTLITCRGYNEASNSYTYRVAVGAVLVAVK